jgi:hypothetical protein
MRPPVPPTLLLALLGCVEEPAPHEPATPDPTEEPCASPAIEDVPLRRLSRVQLTHTLQQLASELVVEESRGWVVRVATELAATLPADQRRGAAGEVRGGSRRLDQDVAQEHADAWIALAAQLGGVIGEPWAVQQWLNCPVWQTPEPCAERYVREAGRRILRRPLDEEEVGFHLETFRLTLQSAPPEADPIAVATRTLASALLADPRVAFHVEHTISPTDLRLDAWSLANRLSYHLWQSPPDAELAGLADDGSLLDPAVYQAQVRRLYADPRTGETVEELFGEWLRVDDLPEVRVPLGTARFAALLGGLELAGDATEGLADELRALGRFYAHDAPASLDDLLTSDLHVSQHPTVSALYGLPPWDGLGNPPALPEPERAGLLTRAGLLVSGSDTTRPIHKGVLIREALLCGVVPPPPDNAATPPAPGPLQGAREVVETLTEQPGSTCAACHADLINPSGFATEGFDALGRVRQEETLRYEDGEIAAVRPIRTEGTTTIAGLGRASFAGPHELTGHLVRSGAVHACFARQLSRWTFGTATPDAAQACATTALTSDLREGLSLDEALIRLALDPAFRLAGGAR